MKPAPHKGLATAPRRRGRACPATSGAVLLEVVLALVLFVAAAAVVTSALNASMESVERQRLTAHAADLAVTALSELQLGLRSTAVAGPQDFESPFKDWTCEIQVEALDAGFEDTASASRVEVIIRSKTTPLVYRLARMIRFETGSVTRKEPDVAPSF